MCSAIDEIGKFMQRTAVGQVKCNMKCLFREHMCVGYYNMQSDGFCCCCLGLRFSLHEVWCTVQRGNVVVVYPNSEQ